MLRLRFRVPDPMKPTTLPWTDLGWISGVSPKADEVPLPLRLRMAP
jgi:hypothetical protein